jgi:hypothetical protein
VGEYALMLGAVVLEDPADILEVGDAPHVNKEEGDAHQAGGEVEKDGIGRCLPGAADQGRGGPVGKQLEKSESQGE